MSKPELSKFRDSWKQAIKNNNEAGQGIWTVRNLELVRIPYKDNETPHPWTVRNRTKDVQVGELFSDHKIISVTLKLSNSAKKVVKRVQLFRKANFQLINYNLSMINWDVEMSCMSLEEKYEFFVSVLQHQIALHVPCKNINVLAKKHGPKILSLQKEKLRIWRAAGNSDNYKKISLILKEELIQEDQMNTEKSLTYGTSKKFFKFINSRYKSNDEIGVIKDSQNIPVNSNILKAELLSDAFSKVFTVDNSSSTLFPSRTNNVLESMTFEPSVIEKVLLKLVPKCNTTPDEIPAIFLKKVGTSIAIPLSIIFSESFRTSQVPRLWKTAIVKPLHKKGPRTDPNNYRPISLTSSVCKVMEKLVPSNMSTESQLTSYFSTLISNHSLRKPTYSVYVDFKKAFDTVSFEKLTCRLMSYGIKGQLLDWIVCFLTNRTQRVNVNGVLSQEKFVLSGVPQGSVLGPLLFLLFINDIGDKFQSHFLLYADDLKLFSTNPSTIQTDLGLLSEWCDKWQMSVAPNKCENIIFNLTKSPRTLNFDFTIKGSKIPRTKKIRDLGLILSSDLPFSEHIDTILRRSHQRINIFFNILRRASFETFIKCYTIYVRPILEYGSIVFNPVLKEQIKRIESVQKSFVYRVFKKFHIPYLNYFDALSVCNLTSLELRRLHADLVFFLNCWNDLSPSVFPPTPHSINFISNISYCNFQKYLTLNPHNF
ncbi:hypothetical protein CAEBREN_32852 [Caenorhabditis brenneri]|uniref:Reverse transcriptase domain-containing protein n=1 Tax=Caenorhabditis brenneri TaxID=135651 RepID=G0NBB9_CAEBE|nr:hypothetical protein CAEBREN_32852 [Caenorhabditis brenneri]